MVEVGVVTLDPSGTVQERWHTLVNPGRDLGAQAIHGISGAEVMDAPYFHQIIPELTSCLRNRVDQHAHRASGRDNNRRVVVGICGFDRSFRYGGGDTAEEALTALPIFLNDEWAGVLYEAMTRQLLALMLTSAKRSRSFVGDRQPRRGMKIQGQIRLPVRVNDCANFRPS